MSDLKKIDKISAAEVNQNGVVSLAVRPNQPSQYGEGNLSAKELQKRFDLLARLAIGKINVIIELLEGTYSPTGSGGGILGGENESILEYILALKASENVPYDISLKELFNRILTEDGQLKAIDPAADNQHEELNIVLSNLYNAVSEASQSLDNINSKLPRSMLVGTDSNKNHFFAFRDKDGNTIEESAVKIDLFLYHNKDTQAHKDLFDGVDEKIDDLSTTLTEFESKVNNILNSDDVTLDQTKEIVAYIKNNKDLIEGITTSKVSVSDIVDNMTTSLADKPLSANQGVEIKKLLDNCVKRNRGSGTRFYVEQGDNPAVLMGVTEYGDTLTVQTVPIRMPTNSGNHPGTFEISHPELDPTKPAYSAKHPMTVGTAESSYAKKTDLDNLTLGQMPIATSTTPGAVRIVSGGGIKVSEDGGISLDRNESNNIDIDKLVEELDKRYAKLSDLEACFDELHEYAQGIISGVSE